MNMKEAKMIAELHRRLEAAKVNLSQAIEHKRMADHEFERTQRGVDEIENELERWRLVRNLPEPGGVENVSGDGD